MKYGLEQLFGGLVDYIGMEEGNTYWELIIGEDAKPTHDIKVTKENKIYVREHGTTDWMMAKA